MWKVQRITDGEFIVLRLSGRIDSRQLKELQNVVESEAREQNAVLDLKDLRLVDQDTVLFLAEREAAGTRLRNCPAFIREWIDVARRALATESCKGEP